MKLNFWDRFVGGIRPKSFKKKAEHYLLQTTLIQLMNYGKAKWIKTEEIVDFLLNKPLTDFDFKDKRVQKWFAGEGMKKKISEGTHKLRLVGHPIIAGSGRKGYRYANEDCSDVDELWEDRRRMWEKSKNDILKQAKIDNALLDKVIKKMKEGKKKEKLKEVQIAYQKYISKKNKDEES